MLATLHDLLLIPHIVAGALGLAVFWVPVLARKGGPLHRRAGAVFVGCMWVVTTTAILTCLMVLVDPAGVRMLSPEALDRAEADALAARLGALFLLLLSLLVLAALRHGMLALAARRGTGRLGGPGHRALHGALLLTCAASLGAGLRYGVILLVLFGIVGAVTGARQLRESLGRPDRSTLLVAHLRGLLVSGIGAHTAFLVFGGRALFPDAMPQGLQIALWVAPTVIGTLAIHRFERRFRSRAPRESVRSTPV